MNNRIWVWKNAKNCRIPKKLGACPVLFSCWLFYLYHFIPAVRVIHAILSLIFIKRTVFCHVAKKRKNFEIQSIFYNSGHIFGINLVNRLHISYQLGEGSSLSCHYDLGVERCGMAYSTPDASSLRYEPKTGYFDI